MHPVERLRYVARASGVPQRMLVQETAGALASFSHDPHGLVTACRRMIGRQPGSAALVWLAARAMGAGDPWREIQAAAAEIEDDSTSRELRYAIPDDSTVCVIGWPEVIGEALPARGDLEVLVVDVLDEGTRFVQALWDREVEAVDVPVSGLGAAVAASDVLLLESPAIGPDRALAVAGSRAAAAVAHHAHIPVWLVGGVGRILPGPLWERVVEPLIGDDPWDGDDEVLPLELVTHVAGPHGVVHTAEAVSRPDCAVVAELLRPAV